MHKANRKRNKAITIRMTKSEYADLQARVAESGLSQQAFIINAVRGATIPSSDEIAVLKDISMTFAEYVKQLRGIGTNLNPMAHVANGQGYLPGKNILLGISDQVGNMRKDGEYVWQSIRSSINQPTVTEL